MNKQQLASRIWQTANSMRSSIDAGEYKDFILGFIFYKYLSEKELRFLRKSKWEDEDIRNDLNEDNADDYEWIREENGYFIAYDSLFSTWLDPKFEFKVDDVITSLNAFARNVSDRYKPVFDEIFDALSKSLGKLGDTPDKQTKAVMEILKLVDPIPMSSREGYDVLGFIYEYLIQNFAATAGKKAGEFYTPHEVSLLMSEIVAHHLDGRDNISIYDSTSGSASLLLNIGTAIARRNGNPEGIKYYAQELKEATYNLTRMNLVMRDIVPANIQTRRADTLEADWPRRSDADEPLRVDACVSNPPYSQSWVPKGKKNDQRFKYYGLAPRGKADYAFLLHNLYHLRRNGIMCIVLPHGVLFRGDAEGEIRSKLVDRGNIEAIIGLPPNIFFGTGIPTIVMVLRPERENDDILIIDASKGFVKDGKKNRLRARDIRRIFDAYVNRKSVEGFCRLVPKQEVVDNDYNLNIPRYVDSFDPVETWDIYATVLGGIPQSEIDTLSRYWDALPGLREALFAGNGDRARAACDNPKPVIEAHESVRRFLDDYSAVFDGLSDELYDCLVNHMDDVRPVADEERLVRDVFVRVSQLPLVDPYLVYQQLDDAWRIISEDVEMIQSEGHGAITQVDQHMVLRKKDDQEEEVWDRKEPWVGHILPFDLVQHELFASRLEKIERYEAEAQQLASSITELLEEMDDEEREGTCVKDSGDAFDFAEVDKVIDEMYAEKSNEIAALVAYKAIGTKREVKAERLAFVREHPEVSWAAMRSSAGTYSAKAVNERLAGLRESIVLDPNSLLARLRKVSDTEARRKETAKVAREARVALRDETKTAIETLSDDVANELLRAKWIDSLMDGIATVPDAILSRLAESVSHLYDKYSVTLADISQQEEQTSS